MAATCAHPPTAPETVRLAEQIRLINRVPDQNPNP
jgi:hypothetical protein